MKTLILFAVLCVACYAGPTEETSLRLSAPTQAKRANTFTIIGEYPKDDCQVFLITKQEAADVCKAMEILDGASRPRSENMGFMSSYSTDLVYRPNGFSTGEKAAMAREEAAFYEAKAKAEAEQHERLQWARSILELWNKKVEASK